MEAILKNIQRPFENTTLDKLLETENGQFIEVVLRAIKVQEPECDVPRTTLSGNELRKGVDYVVEVKSWMMKPTVDDSFDFMQKWNNNIPVPFKIMKGRVLKETRGTLYMELRACVMHTDRCIRCGRPLTHPVSKLYGLGPECGNHAHINPFDTEEELNAALSEIKKKLDEVRWTGWIAKSGIQQAKEAG